MKLTKSKKADLSEYENVTYILLAIILFLVALISIYFAMR